MIQRFIALALAGLWTATLWSQADIENPAVFQRNQTAPHATLMPYEGPEQALKAERHASANYLSLNGTWKFHLAAHPSLAPAGFFKPGFLHAGWSEISVPSNWQMEGFGYPLFRNIGLPHPFNPPAVPDDYNPVGSYYRSFELPDGWKEKEVFLHFEGVQSAFHLWVNGKEVGYNQGGMEPAEFDISKFLKAGSNSVALRVYRYCDGSYLEDQDTWRLSGIYRNVYLMATPRVHLRDFYVRTDLDEAYEDAELQVDLQVENYGKGLAKGYSCVLQLYDPDGEPVPGARIVQKTGDLSPERPASLNAALEISRPLLWSAEKPHLYTLVMELRNAGGESVEFLSTRVGFREVEIRDGAILVNGVAVKFNGVNSHMMHPETGHAMDRATMEADLKLMKRFNINCVRTSHYPPNVEYLELADELGMYIVDETGDEAHAYLDLSGDSIWRPQYLDRMRKMVYRDRNHPSIVIWSAGNESGPGDNICALIKAGKQIDPSRPGWMYGGNQDEDPDLNPISCEDIVGPRYLQPFRLEQRFGKADDPRPSFMDEYIAATGNSLGGLDEYWALIRRYPRLTGGAIWDWVSPGISAEVLETTDDSPNGIRCVLMNRARLEQVEGGLGLYLSGHDDWLEVARDPALDITGEGLSISFRLKPGKYRGYGALVTKGDYQFGLRQSDATHLDFYVNTQASTDGPTVLSARLPDKWEDHWHHVAAIYDGRKLQLYVDGSMIGTRVCQGRIINAPYPLNVGKSAELRDSHRGYLSQFSIDELRVFDRAVALDSLSAGSPELRPQAKLWLDFETARKGQKYYFMGLPGRTYGLVWPNRKVQPELWQLKKSPQAVAFRALDLEEGRFLLHNYFHFSDLSEFDLRWRWLVDGRPQREGDFSLALAPGESTEYRLPVSGMDFKAGHHHILELSVRLRQSTPWADAGHELAWEQFELPFEALPTETKSYPLPAVQEDEASLLISGEGFSLRFSKEDGALLSMKCKDLELLKQSPHFNVWRAPLANDLDTWNFWHVDPAYTREGMGRELANGWRSTGLDRLQFSLDEMRWNSIGNRVEVLVEGSYHANRYGTGFKTTMSYAIAGNGELEIRTHVIPSGELTTWLPKMGLQWQLPEEFGQIDWFGRGPYENYPDRKSGAKVGVYHSSVKEDEQAYLIPQDYGNRCDVRWLRLSNAEGRGIEVRSDRPFCFSAHPYRTETLDRAQYRFQLEHEDLVNLSLDYMVSGVGGTANSVLNPYRVQPHEADFSFCIRLLCD
ncbi:MAG: glycoside hydrolase family 2 [Bacteroidetes bacterium]|nr:MAG: glycoside hydrolase family 2 [Bacteroidota bacterium]